MPETATKTAKEPTSDLDILAQARKDFQMCEDGEKQPRAEHSRCMRFIALEQYPENGAASKNDRAGAGLPSLVVDNLGPICDQIINDWIRNRMGINIGPGDSVANEETAKVFSGYVRNLEYLSHARWHYDSAFKQMVRGNRGYVGVLTRRKPGTFKQELIIRGFPDAQAVYFDPFCQELDLSDNHVTFVRQLVSFASAKAECPGIQNTNFSDWGSDYGSWVKEDGFIKAEYWKVHYEDRKLQKLTHKIPIQRGSRQIITDEVYDDEYDDLPKGVTVAKNPDDGGANWEEDEPKRIITCRTITGCEILHETVWPGKIIPIVPMCAKEIIVDGERRKFSAISRALDPQCQLNYAESGIAAELGSEVHVPWVGALGQFKTMRQAWQDSNIKRFPFLEYDMVIVGDKAAPPPQRQNHEPAIMAFSHASDRAQANIRMTTGVNKSNLGEPDGTAVSGVAKKAQIAEGDNSTSDFPAAGMAALELIGSIIVDVAPQVLTEPEIIQILDDQEKQASVLVNADPVTFQGAPKDQVDAHFLDQGEYKVRVTAAPTSQTMRDETEAALKELFAELPEPQKVMIAAPLVRQMSFNGKDEIAERLELPQFAKPKDGAPNIPPEAQQVIQQGKQLIDAANAHIAQLEKERDSKQVEIDAKLKMNANDNETKLGVAEIGKQIAGFQAEVNMIHKMLGLITDHLQIAQDQASQESAQQHQADMATQSQAATAATAQQSQAGEPQ